MTKPQCVAADFDADIDIVYAMHDVFKRQSEVEIFPMCIDQAIEIAPYSQRGGGMLTGKYANGGAGRLTKEHRYSFERMRRAVLGLSTRATALGIQSPTLAVARAMSHPACPRPIMSAGFTAQVQRSVEAMTFGTAAEIYDRITAPLVTPPPANDRAGEL